MKYRKNLSILLVLVLLLSISISNAAYGLGTGNPNTDNSDSGVFADNVDNESVASTPTPAPIEVNPVEIDNTSNGYTEKGEWFTADGGVNGHYRYTTKIGSSAMWRFKVQEDGFYDISALLPRSESETPALAKYTVFYNGTYIDSFYNTQVVTDSINDNQAVKEMPLRKNFGKFIEFRKDNWVTVIVKSVSEGKCIADAISVKLLSYGPTPMPTAPAGFSKPTLRYAKDCDLQGFAKESNYVGSSNSGDYIVLDNVLLSGFGGFDSLSIFSVNAVVTGGSSDNKLEIRLDSLEGPILGSVDLNNTVDGSLKFIEQAYRLSNVNSDFKYKNVYIIYRGEGKCYIDWIKLSNPSKVEPAQTETLDADKRDTKICGYVKPGFDTTNKELYKGFRVEIEGINLLCETDSNGYFEAFIESSGTVSFVIRKGGYLLREFRNVVFVDKTVQIGTKDKPVDIWPGDMTRDGAVNMLDIVQISKGFNSIEGDSRYNVEYDINGDGAINLVDIVIVAKYFNKTAADYKKAI